MFLLVATCVSAATHPTQNGRISSIELKVHTRVLYYIVNTPITRDEPYYEITVDAGDVQYLTEYMPRHGEDELPAELKLEAELTFSVEGHHLFIKRAGASELDLTILKRKKNTGAVGAPRQKHKCIDCFEPGP